jgi:hypothetical protein
MLNTAHPATILEQVSVGQLNDEIHGFHAMGESMAGMIKFFRGNAGWKGYFQIPFREHCHFSAPQIPFDLTVIQIGKCFSNGIRMNSQVTSG